MRRISQWPILNMRLNLPPMSTIIRKSLGLYRTLSEAEQEIVGGKVLHAWRSGEALNSRSIQKWVETNFSWTPSASWVSNLLKDYNVSAHSVRLQQAELSTPEIRAKITDTLRKLDSLNLQAGMTVAIDATGFLINKGNRTGYGPSGRCVLAGTCEKASFGDVLTAHSFCSWKLG